MIKSLSENKSSREVLTKFLTCFLARHKLAKKRNLHVVNEHFESIYNAARGRVRGFASTSQILFFIVLAWSPACLSADQVNNEWTLEKVMQERARIKESKAKFKEVKTTAALTSFTVSEGNLLYRAPAYLEKHYRVPDDILIQVKKKGIWITQEDGEQQYIDLDAIPVLQAFVESLRGTLAGDIDSIKKYYQVKYAVEQDKWRMELLPHEESVSQYIDVIIITGQQADVLSIEVRESGGDISTTYIQ